MNVIQWRLMIMMTISPQVRCNIGEAEADSTHPHTHVLRRLLMYARQKGDEIAAHKG